MMKFQFRYRNLGRGKTNQWNCGTAEPVEPVEPTEPKDMTVLLQLPLANVIKLLVSINFFYND